MPRTARAIEAGAIYHVLNRGNGGMKLFNDPQDYRDFQAILAEGLQRYPMELFTYSLMPNHWHLAVRPRTDEAVGQLLGWVGVTHVRRYHARHRSRRGGHVYQGRFKCFPVQDGYHFLRVCRYIEANPLRAGLVAQAERWPWSGLWQRQQRKADVPLAVWPESRPRNWSGLVNQSLAKEELEALRVCVQRGRPYGALEWVAATASRLGLDFTLRRPGRPRRTDKNE